MLFKSSSETLSSIFSFIPWGSPSSMSIVYLQQRLLGRFQGSAEHPPIQIVLIGLETNDELLVGWAHQRGCQLVAVPALGYEGSCGEDRCFHVLVGPGLGPGWFSGRDIFC